jgi:membrane protease YdiL (CAAX protease family)
MPTDKPQQIASWPHLAGYLLINAGIVAWGFHVQAAGMGNAAAGQIADHSQSVKNYLIDIAADCALLYYCWVGVHWRGGNLETLSGGRWTSWKQLLTDVAIALPFWVLWEATAYGVHWLLGPSTARSVAALLPQTVPEILLWILVSITAGFTEELQSRGYLQRQFHALSGSIVVAVLGQAVIFGLMHSYQGWKQVIVISALGVLYGALAAWRKNLRANMIAHAWSDVWEGWLKMVVWK